MEKNKIFVRTEEGNGMAQIKDFLPTERVKMVYREYVTDFNAGSIIGTYFYPCLVLPADARTVGYGDGVGWGAGFSSCGAGDEYYGELGGRG